jgi:hypothetical protein
VSFARKFTIWVTIAEIFQLLYIWNYLPIAKSAVYGTNDDALIASISSGQLTGSPEGHLVFINPILSFPIAWLQSFLSNINIYTLSLLLFVTLSFSLILALIMVQNNLRLESKIILSIFWLLSTVTFVSWYILAPTYTAASLFMSGTSSCFAYYYFSQTFNRIESRVALVLSVITLLISLSIRRESFYLYIFFLLIIIVVQYKNIQRHLKKSLFFGIVTLLIFILNLGAEKLVYNNGIWKEYYQTNSLRHIIQTREPERILETRYSEIGWSRSNLDLFIRFILVDRDYMNSTNMMKINEFTQENNLSKVINFFTLSNLIANTKIAFNAWTWIVMLFTFQFISILISIRVRKDKIKFIFFAFLVTIGVPSLYLILNIYFKLPDRISVSVMAMVSLLILALGLDTLRSGIKQKTIFTFIQLSLVLIFSFFYLQRFQVELQARAALYKDLRDIGSKQQESLSSLPDEVLVIGSASVIKAEYQNPYVKFSSLDRRNKTIILGWHNLSPTWEASMQKYNLPESDFYRNLMEPNIYWATYNDDAMVMKNHLSEILNKDISVIDLGPIGYEKYHFYKF